MMRYSGASMSIITNMLNKEIENKKMDKKNFSSQTLQEGINL